MARKRTADNDAPPPRRSNRIQELAQRTTAQESQSKPLVPKKSKTANPRVKKVTSTEKPSAKPSTARKAATVTVRKGNSTGRNVKRKIEEPQPENATSEEDISTLPKRDTLPSGNVKPHNGELILRTAVFVSDLRSSDFGDLYKLVITSDIWKKLPEDDNGVLSIPTLTELELRGVTFPGARRALMFVMSFPKLKKLALDDVRVSSDVEFEDEEMENLLQKIGGPTPNLLSLWIGNIDDSDVNPAFHLLYNIIVEVAIDSLEDLYVHRYEPALEIVRSSVSLNRLHLHLAREPKDYITAVALCHISDVQIGFDVCEIQASGPELDQEAELVIQWLIECLEMEVDPDLHALKRLDVRCTVKNAPEACLSLESEMLDDLNNMLQQERFSTLTEFSVTTVWEDYEDNPLSVSRVQCLHGEIVRKMKVMKNRCARKRVNEYRHDEDWPLVSRQNLPQWFVKTKMTLRPPLLEESDSE